MKMHFRARGSNFCLGEQLPNRGNQKFLGEKMKVIDYIVAQKVIAID